MTAHNSLAVTMLFFLYPKCILLYDCYWGTKVRTPVFTSCKERTDGFKRGAKEAIDAQPKRLFFDHTAHKQFSEVENSLNPFQATGATKHLTRQQSGTTLLEAPRRCSPPRVKYLGLPKSIFRTEEAVWMKGETSFGGHLLLCPWSGRASSLSASHALTHTDACNFKTSSV